jgi:hypothetical protein
MGNVITKKKMDKCINKIINNYVLPYCIPEDRVIKIDNHEVFIIKSRFKLDSKRKFIETLCVLDLLRHERNNKVIFGPSIRTVVSEEAYFDALCMVDHIKIPGSIIHQALEKYPEQIRITSDALKSYAPTSNFIYISFVSHN